LGAIRLLLPEAACDVIVALEMLKVETPCRQGHKRHNQEQQETGRNSDNSQFFDRYIQ
jgi:hypothetical protein